MPVGTTVPIPLSRGAVPRGAVPDAAPVPEGWALPLPPLWLGVGNGAMPVEEVKGPFPPDPPLPPAVTVTVNC